MTNILSIQEYIYQLAYILNVEISEPSESFIPRSTFADSTAKDNAVSFLREYVEAVESRGSKYASLVKSRVVYEGATMTLKDWSASVAVKYGFDSTKPGMQIFKVMVRRER